MTESQRYSLESVEIANRAGERLGSVTSRIGEIDSMNQSVATATEEQTAVHDLAKVGVASSSLVSRSKFYSLASAGLVKVRRQRFGFGRTGNKL